MERLNANIEPRNAAPHWLGMEAPRYTSYPSAHHFARMEESPLPGWLEGLEADTRVSAYVHIPYCRELCWFCGCHTKATRRYEPVAKYVRVLLREIEALAPHLRGALANIHFGGGSPSLLEPGDLMGILYALTSAFGSAPEGEVAIELDPRTADAVKIAAYAQMGFNRVSIGIQDFDPQVQQAINRVQPYDQVKGVVDALRSHGLGAFNCDLIYGLPFQTEDRFRATLEQALSLDPARIALFSYAHMPQLKKHQRLIAPEWLPAEAEKLELYLMACGLLEKHGYVMIGIDHFAKADDALSVALKSGSLRRNFQGYVTDATQALVGFGSSAISQFPQGYAQNSADTPDYLACVQRCEIPTVRGWAFRGDDTIRKQVVDTLMCFLSVDLAAVCAQFHLPEGYFCAELEALRGPAYRALALVEGEAVRLITPYRMAVRVVASVFDRYRGETPGRYSKVA